MVESSSVGELVAVVSGLAGLGALAVRICGGVALARQHRRAMTALARTVVAAGRPVRAQQRVSGGEWSIVLDLPQEPATERGERDSIR